MRKIFSLVVLCLLVVSCASVHNSAATSSLAAGDSPLAFLEVPWTEDHLYPEWYAGRYIGDGKVLTYVVVEGYEAQAIEALGGAYYVVEDDSYNVLMFTLDEITFEWMDTQPKDEVVCLQSAWLDEVGNRVGVELYTGSERVEEMREALLDRFGSLITVGVTDSLIEFKTAAVVPSSAKNQFYRWFLLVPLIGVMGFVVWRRRMARSLSLQTAEGVVAGSRKMSSAEVAQLVRSSKVSPGADVYERIAEEIERPWLSIVHQNP